MSKDIEKQEKGNVPDLVRPPLDISSEDIALPRIKIGQFMTQQVKSQLAGAGDIFASTGEDDATVLWEADSKDDGLLVHVISLRKGKSITVDGELVTYAFDDTDAPPDAWTTYNYLVALPEVDLDVPYKWLLTRTGRPAAQQLNTVLLKNTDKPAWHTAFRVTTAERNNKKGTYYVPRIAIAEADKDNVEAIEGLAVQVLSASGSEAEAPKREKVDI